MSRVVAFVLASRFIAGDLQPPAAPPSTTVRPEETAPPSTTVRPGETAPPSTTVRPGETAPPSTTVRPGETAPPSTTVRPGETVPPSTTVRPGETAPPSTTVRPGETAPPSTNVRPEGTAPPSTTVRPGETAPPSTNVQSPEAASPFTTGPTPGTPTSADAATPVVAAPRLLPPPPNEPSRSYPEPPLDGHGMVVAGVALVVTSVVGYVAMAVGFGIANYAEDSLTPLLDPEDASRRQQLERRVEVGQHLALGAGVSAAALLVTGIPLIVVGRRRARADLQRREKLRVTASPGGVVVEF